MTFTAGLDSELGDTHFDVSKKEKPLIRATLKTYERNYIFLKLFKKSEHDYELQQRITLALEEFEMLTKNSKNLIGCLKLK